MMKQNVAGSNMQMTREKKTPNKMRKNSKWHKYKYNWS